MAKYIRYQLFTCITVSLVRELFITCLKSVVQSSINGSLTVFCI